MGLGLVALVAARKKKSALERTGKSQIQNPASAGFFLYFHT